MAVDQPGWFHLSLRRSKQLGFLWNEKKRIPEAPCRRPGCSEVVNPRKGRGRTKWFHDAECAKLARRRRRALDEAVADLAESYYRPGTTWRERSSIAWEAMWLMGVRAGYASDDDAVGLVPARREAIDRLRDELAGMTKRRPRTPSDRCPTCRGTGDLSRLRAKPSSIYALKKRRDANDALASAAPVFRELWKFPLSLEVVEALGVMQPLADRAERRLQQSVESVLPRERHP
jgi:hypothetical protein